MLLSLNNSVIMNKNNKKNLTLVGGVAAFSESEKNGKSVGFVPTKSKKCVISGFSGDAYLTVRPDGRFIVKLRRRIRSLVNVITRMDHGCLTRTRDNAVLLTIKIFQPEEQDVARILVNESWEAAKAYNELTKD